MIDFQLNGVRFRFETDSSRFLPKSADRGSLLILEHIIFSHEDIVLNVGRGYGLIGIYAAKCIRSD